MTVVSSRVIFLIVNLMTLIGVVQNKLTLKQVVILNRHSIRAPLSDSLEEVSSKVWPKWNERPGFLTAKGSTLAGYMGNYFAEWLRMEEVLPLDCPTEDDLYVLSNAMERTLTSAQSFVQNGFPDCNVTVHGAGINVSDSIFNPVIHNTTAVYREQAIEAMQEALNTVYLNNAYDLLSQILDYNGSKFCEYDKECNLSKIKHCIGITPGSKPRLSGPLKITNDIIDNFLMQIYEGFSTENIAWGQLTDKNLWRTILELNKAYFNVKYKTRIVASDVSRPLINYIANIFLKDDNKPKATLLVGHDINFYTLFTTLSVKSYRLQKQDEVIPIGSAVVFQRWSDDECKKNYLKITYVYQTTKQLRQSTYLSLNSPPMCKVLELEDCQVDENGFCDWDDFKSILSNNIQVDILD